MGRVEDQDLAYNSTRAAVGLAVATAANDLAVVFGVEVGDLEVGAAV